MSPEPRARRRIRLAVENRGYQLKTLTWEPWYNAGEKAGIGGGWHGELDRPYLKNTFPGDDICGLSVEDVLAFVDSFVKPPEPCDCGLTHYPLNPLRDAPETGLHLPSCRWHIAYRLRWWKS